MEFIKKLTDHQLIELRLAGLAFSRSWINEMSEDETLGLMKVQWQNQLLRNSVYLRAYKAIAKAAIKDNLALTPLKGIELITTLYRNPGERFLSDIDLLIAPKDLPGLQAILLQQGYQRILSKPTSLLSGFKEIWQIELHGFMIPIEIHTRLFFSEPKSFHWEKDSHGSLSKEAFFVHLCGHYAFQHTFLQPLWLIDLCCYLDRFSSEMDFRQVMDLSQRLNLHKAVEVSILLAQKYRQQSDQFLQHFSFSGKSQCLAQNLDFQFLSNPQAKPLRYLQVKHQIKDCFLDSLKYDALWLWDKVH